MIAITSDPPRTAMRDNLRGILAMMAAMFALTMNFAFVKLAGGSLPVGEVLFLRGLIAALIISMAVVVSGAHRHLREVLHPTVFLRTFFESAAAVCFVIALMQTSIGKVTVILQAMPLLVTAGATFWLGEKVHWRRWAAIVVGLVGVVIVIRPGLASFQWASLLVVASVLMSSLRDLSTRSMPYHIPTVLVAVVALCTLSLVGLSFSLFEDWVVPSGRAAMQAAGSGALLSLGLFFVVLAMRRGELSIIAPFRYSAVLWAVILGYTIWGDALDRPTMIGAFIIIGSGIYISFRERDLRAAVPTAHTDTATQVIPSLDRDKR